MDETRKTKRELIAELKTLRLRTATLEDLTRDQRQLVRQLDESSAIYKGIFDLCPDAIVILQGDSYSLVSSGFTRIFGYTQDDVDKGLSFYNLVQECDRPAVKKRYESRINGEDPPPTYHIDLVAKDGSLIPCETSAAHITHNGQPADLVVIRDISTRLASERMIAEYQANLDQLAANIPQVLWLISADLTEVMYISPAYERIWGRSCQSVREKPDSWMDSVVAEDLERVREIFARYGPDLHLEIKYRIRRPDGAVRWILTRGVPVRGADGEIRQYAGLSEDITERIEAEERIQFLSQITEQVADSIMVTDVDHRVVYVNHAFRDLFGYSQEEILAQVPGFIISEPNAEQRHREIVESISAGKVWRGEVEHRRKDGSTLPVALVVSPLFDQNGKLTGFAGSQRDITVSKAAQEARRASEAQYRILLESQPDGVVLMAPDRKVVFVNEAMCRLSGRSRDEILHGSPERFMPPDDWKRAQTQITARLEGTDTSTREYRMIHKDGSLTPIEVRGHLISFQGESRLLIVIRDLSERKRWEDAIRAHEENLERLVEERTTRIRELERQRTASEKHVAAGRMAAQIAHEVNNPLAGIKNAFSLIKDAIPATHQHYEYVGRIEREIGRIGAIVHQMFNLYRPDQAVPREFRLNEAISDVIALLEGNCRERNIVIGTQNVSGDTYHCAEGLLVQILFNIIANAVEASPDGGFVDINTAATDRAITISVEDRGPGIPRELRERIFEPFFTTKTDGPEPRLGLGLSITRGLAKSLGATLSLECNEGGGTVFSLRLPRQPEERDYR